MSDREAAAREALRQTAGELESLRFRLLGIHASLPVSPREDAMLLGEEDPDFPTEARSVLECVLHDWLRPAIRDLQAAADYQPGGPA